jgi:hypothetical protein
VDGLINVVEDAAILAEEGDDLAAPGVERDLGLSSARNLRDDWETRSLTFLMRMTPRVERLTSSLVGSKGKYLGSRASAMVGYPVGPLVSCLSSSERMFQTFAGMGAAGRGPTLRVYHSSLKKRRCGFLSGLKSISGLGRSLSTLEGSSFFGW